MKKKTQNPKTHRTRRWKTSGHKRAIKASKAVLWSWGGDWDEGKRYLRTPPDHGESPAAVFQATSLAPPPQAQPHLLEEQGKIINKKVSRRRRHVDKRAKHYIQTIPSERFLWGFTLGSKCNLWDNCLDGETLPSWGCGTLCCRGFCDMWAL